ncbi:MAG: hypothetical protein JSW60_02995 [Thermoplasmatales archaeon]|nr:MAG: hypothetical protein JSW60_02995 [Thermoplasmatales archaeon]
MEGKVEQTKIKKFTTFLIILLLLLTFTNVPIALISLVKTACAADIATYSDSNSQIRITIPGEEPPPPPPPGLDTTPRILWYDLQSKAGFSKLNSQIDVNQEYKFCISISSDQGWDDIDYIDISAWYDNGSESTTYNNSGNLGGNLNMLLQYENTTGVANYTMLWPDDEVTVGSFTESAETDPNGSAGFTECRNLTFFFTPGYQFRYAPGDGGWNNTTNAYNDIWSWNFKISVKDGGENASGPSTVSVIDEFGVYSYTEIVSEGLPSIQGIPGNVSEASNVNITTRSNVYYSLSVDVDTFLHKTHSTANMSNQTIWVRGGNLITFTNFTGNEPIYLYGSSTTFVDAEDNNTSKTINNVGYKCNIPFGQLPGDYYATTYYMFRTPIT